MYIRPTHPQDTPNIYKVISSAFDNDGEVKLVQTLHASNDVLCDLVAEQDGNIIGHILISKITLSPDAGLSCGGLAPICVAPDYQRQGVGKALMQHAINTCTQQGIDALFLLGDPAYYSKFGFVVSHIGNAYSPDYFQHLELKTDCLKNITATATYADAFHML